MLEVGVGVSVMVLVADGVEVAGNVEVGVKVFVIEGVGETPEG